MIRSILVSTLLLIACTFAQSTWFGGIALFGVVPDLSLIVLIWYSYKNGQVEGPISGFLSGLAEDFLSTSPLGFHAFVKTAVAAVTAILHGSFFIDRLILPILLGIGGTLVKAVSVGALSLLFGSSIHAYSFVDKVLWIESGYNGILAPLVFLLLSPLSRFLVTERGRG
jgi:rod shape-determining protein MreD